MSKAPITNQLLYRLSYVGQRAEQGQPSQPETVPPTTGPRQEPDAEERFARVDAADKGSPSFPADDRRRAAAQLDVVRACMVETRGSWTLAELATRAGCSEASASARIRDLRKEGWEVIRWKLSTGVYAYLVKGRAPLEPAKHKPRDSELDALRARIERLEAGLAALNTRSA